MKSPRVLGVGIIGAGEVAQVIHLPTLSLLSHLYTVVAICDVSQNAAVHCAKKFHISETTTDPYELIGLPEVEVIFILTSDQFHAPYAIAALQAGKNVMLEKPLTLSVKAGLTIVEAEKAAKGPRVFVGYMRRYAPSFTEAFKREIATIPRILYARSRDIIGPNSHFVSQSGTNPLKFTDYPPEASKAAQEGLETLLQEALGKVGVTPSKVEYWRFLASLGSHDLSLMREALGFPDSVAGVSVNHPFYSAIFNYRNANGDGEPFAVTYESGIDAVPRFDAHLTVYGETKTVSIQYDTPYVKGLPIKVRVDELVDGQAVAREILPSYEDAYTVELKEMYECFTEGKEIKTSAEDAMNDLHLWTMMMKKHNEDLLARDSR
jgi:predicted dehydrogenase